MLVIASLALPLAGCAVGPDFVPPAAPLADNFTVANNRSLKTDHQDYRDWWRAFHDPTLNRLIQIAYNQNLTLLSAGTRVLQARAALGIAVGEFYPQVQQGIGSLTYNQASAATPLAAPNSTPNRFWTNSLAAQAAWELDFWGKFRRGVESADAAYLASIATYDQVLVTLLGDVAATYIGIRTTEAAHCDRPRQCPQAGGFAQDRAGEVPGRQHQRAGRFSGDQCARSDPVGNSSAGNPVAAGTDALCVLLGIPPQSLNRLLAKSRGIPTPPYTIAVGIPADLLRRRPDVRAAELAALAQSEQIGIAETQLYPAISISGTFGATASTANGHNLGQIFKSTGVTYAAGPSFQWNILNYGQITNNVRLQDATLQQLLVDYQNAVLAAQQQVDDGIAAFLLSRSQAEDLRRSVVAANGTLKVATEQYDAGATNFTTVLVAEQNLFQYESNLATARANVSLGATAIYRALGGGWQIREDSNFVTAATRDQMRARTNWGDLLPPAGLPQPPAPGLPSPADLGPSVRLPQW